MKELQPLGGLKPTGIRPASAEEQLSFCATESSGGIIQFQNRVHQHVDHAACRERRPDCAQDHLLGTSPVTINRRS